MADGRRSTLTTQRMTATHGGDIKAAAETASGSLQLPLIISLLQKLTFCSLGCHRQLPILPPPFYGLAILSTNRQQGGLLLSPLPVPNLKPYKTHFQSQATPENHRKQPVSVVFGRFFKLFAIAEKSGHISCEHTKIRSRKSVFKKCYGKGNLLYIA